MLFLPLLAYSQGGGENVSWKASWDGNSIVLEGTPASDVDHISGSVSYTPCKGNQCSMPQEYEFDLSKSAAAVASKPQPQVKTAAPIQQSQSKPSLWSLILEAVLWGFAMLLTPCVFPMVPMTVSFFLKGSEDKRKGRLSAFMYGVFIILLYTLPICAIIGITRFLGGAAVTADIFNYLSTHWLPNILFFAIFLAFALSFFGLFEITLPSKWVNGADKNADRGNLGGVFFMALTLVLVSFSCTGPIVGTVLIKSVSGEFWTPVVTMMCFSAAFALPFALLAMFPSLLKNLPKSGGWLNTVKVSLGFIELALGLKFLSVADQTYHWGILPRNVYLAIWIVLFTLLCLYLAGLLKFPGDSPKIKWGAPRAVFLGIVAAFTIYLFSGFYGNPLKALSGYLPPADEIATSAPDRTSTICGEELLENAQREAEEKGLRVFVDITGYGCVNCREMESRVWTDPAVQKAMDEGFVVVRLYVDDKTKLPQNQWFETPDGKLLKDAGRVNAYLATDRFGVNSQPNYFILDCEGNVLKGPYSYNLDIDEFLEFLR